MNKKRRRNIQDFPPIPPRLVHHELFSWMCLEQSARSSWPMEKPKGINLGSRWCFCKPGCVLSSPECHNKHWVRPHQHTLKVGQASQVQPMHPSGILPMDSYLRNPQSWACWVVQEFRLQSKQKTLLCRLNSPLRLKRKPGTIWPWVCRMWWESRESRRLHVTFPQWDDRSLICCRPHRQLQSQTLPVWDANSCPARLWKIMGWSRKEPDLLYEKYYPWTVTTHEISKIFQNQGKK